MSLRSPVRIGLVVLVAIGCLSPLAVPGCEQSRVKKAQKSRELVTARNLGLAYLEEHKLAEAEQEFVHLIQIAPREALGYANLGLVQLRQGNYAGAEEQLKQALTIEPGNADIRLNLAEVYLAQKKGKVLTLLEETLDQTPNHLKTLYKLARIYARSDLPEARRHQEKYLTLLVESSPTNIAARLQLIEILLHNGKADPATRHMEEIRRQIPDTPEEVVDYYQQALKLMRQSKTEAALAPTRIAHNLLKVTPLYQQGILDLIGPGDPFLGFPVLTFSQDLAVRFQDQQTILESMRFTDVTSAAGLDRLPTGPPSQEWSAILAVGDYDRDGDQDLYVSRRAPFQTESINTLFRNDLGIFVEITAAAGIEHPGQDRAALFGDYDNDGDLDLFIANTISNLLYQNTAAGGFQEVAGAAGVGEPDSGYAALWADFDHEGDLDLYLANAGRNRFYRNNRDGIFTELAGKTGIAGDRVPSRDAAFGDLDDDGDLDLLVINQDTRNILYTNLRQGSFQDVTVASGLLTDPGSGAVAVGDYNNDGALDLFLTALATGRHQLYLNQGDGGFKPDPRPEELYRSLQNFSGLEACFLDFDNDGWLDLLVAGHEIPEQANPQGLRLFHNQGSGGFSEVTAIPPTAAARTVRVADYNSDGDLDIFTVGLDGGIRLLRNDGGNANKYLKVQLVGLQTGSGKNNYFGIGAKLEVRAGDLYQMRVVTEPITHFGLAQRQQAEVVRVVWTNGVPQNLFYPRSDQDLIEEQTLKGSCAFLYVWDGREYTFMTDIIWRSALGMPLGIMGGSTAYAYPDASREYVKIPGALLKPKAGVYSLQVTEELWETAYLDQVKLLVIDHPDTVDIYVDERFVPPPYPALNIFTVARRLVPESARDDQGVDLLPRIRAQDDIYVSNLEPTHYQGVTALHDLILDLGDLSAADTVRLFLTGWIFPTDASINVSLSQSDRVKVVAPYVQVLNSQGKWQTVIENMGFPLGKNKTVIANLSGKFLTDDYRLRIRTNMEIYWDHVFYSTEGKPVPLKKQVLPPLTADIHFRGFSRQYRKGGRHGPHWFDYNATSPGPKWRDLEGYYTRYGNVLPLLLEADDQYVIINAGDEVTVTFDAAPVPDLAPGRARDYLIYSAGWIKDGDLNTAHGNTVTPLPFHGMPRYPYGDSATYPQDKERQRYRDKYNTRKVTPDKYRQQVLRPNQAK